MRSRTPLRDRPRGEDRGGDRAAERGERGRVFTKKTKKRKERERWRENR